MADFSDEYNSDSLYGEGQFSDFSNEPLYNQFGSGYEQITEPSNPMEWLECVIFEVVALTGKTLFMTSQTTHMINALLNRGYAPDQAAHFLIQKLGL